MNYSYTNNISRGENDGESGLLGREEYGSTGFGSLIKTVNQNTGNNGVVGTNVLKYYNMISASDFDKYLISKQQEALHKKSLKASVQAVKDKENERFYNLSMLNIANNIMSTLVDVLNDLVKFFNDSHKTFGKLYNIFVKEDRLIYLGLVVLFFSFVLYFITVTV